jgi:hypothetical protein
MMPVKFDAVGILEEVACGIGLVFIERNQGEGR